MARLLVALLVPLMGFGWLADEKTVRLAVDGRAAEISTHAGTVGELLERAGVALAPGDRLEPAPGTALADGMVVELVPAREITLLVGGAERRVVVTALSVEQVLDELGPRLGGDSARAAVRPSRLTRVRPGMVVEVRHPVAVTVVADGASQDIVTDEPTVGRILDGLGLSRGPDDRVTPAEETPAAAGMRIVVQRVAVAEEVSRHPVPAPTEQRGTDELVRGQRRVVAAGRDGLAEITERVVRVDGVVETREVLARRTVRPAQPRVVEVGTADPPASPTPSPSPPPTAADPPEPPSAPTQSDPPPSPEPARNSQTGDASYYHHPDSQGMTAAHRTLPLGTLVTVTNLGNGRSVTVRINDRGPYVEGRIIDLNEPAFARIAPLGAGVIRVRITW